MYQTPAFNAPIQADWLVPTSDYVESEARSVQSDFRSIALKASMKAATSFIEEQDALSFISRRVDEHVKDYALDYCESRVRQYWASSIAEISRPILEWAQSDPYATVRKHFDRPASDAALVDSGWLYLLYPGFGDALAGLACRLDTLAAQASVPSDQPLKKVAAAITAADEDSVALDFWHDLAVANRSFPPPALEILLGAAFMDSGRLILPGYVPCWYPCEERRPGPGRDAIDRAKTWGHYVVSLVLGAQKEALEFWHSYSIERGCTGDASYSQPGQDPSSRRALSAYVMAKGRLFSDLTRVKALPWPVLSGSGSEPSLA